MCEVRSVRSTMFGLCEVGFGRGLQDVITKELKIQSNAAPESFWTRLRPFWGKTLFAEMGSVFWGLHFCIKWIHFILLFHVMPVKFISTEFYVRLKKNENNLIILKLFHRTIEGYTINS